MAANIQDPFKQDRATQAQMLRDIAGTIKSAGETEAQGNLNAAKITRGFSESEKANERKLKSDTQAQVDAIKRIQAQGSETRKTQKERFSLATDADKAAKDSSQATFESLIGKDPKTTDLTTPRGFADEKTTPKTKPKVVRVPKATGAGFDTFVDGKLKSTTLEMTHEVSVPDLEDEKALLEEQIQNALASPDDKAGRKATVFLDNKLQKVNEQLKSKGSAKQFANRRDFLSQALRVPEGAITPGNMTKFETELVDQMFTEGPDIPGSDDVTMQFLIKFPEWQRKFSQMQQSSTEVDEAGNPIPATIDLDSPEILDFLDKNNRMFNTFADKWINQKDATRDPITSQQATLYRAERDKFLKALSPLSELQGYIRRLKQGGIDNNFWDFSLDASEGLQEALLKQGLEASIYDEDEVPELEAALAQMRIETVNPLLRSVENVALNSSTEVQALFVGELLERLTNAGIHSKVLTDLGIQIGILEAPPATVDRR